MNSMNEKRTIDRKTLLPWRGGGGGRLVVLTGGRMDVERLGFGGGQHGVGAAQEGRQADVLGVVRDGVLVLDDAAAVVADLALAARRSFGRRPVRHAVARRGVEAEQLRAHAVVFLQSYLVFVSHHSVHWIAPTFS